MHELRSTLSTELIQPSSSWLDVSSAVVRPTDSYTAEAILHDTGNHTFLIEIKYNNELQQPIGTTTYFVERASGNESGTAWEEIHSNTEAVYIMRSNIDVTQEGNGHGSRILKSRPLHLNLITELIAKRFNKSYTLVEIIVDAAKAKQVSSRSGWTSYMVQTYLQGYSKELGNALEENDNPTFGRVTTHP